MAETAFPIVGGVFTLGVFCSHVPTMKRIYDNADVGDVHFMPYLTLIVSTILWNYYGIVKHNYPIFIINAVGTVFGLFYYCWWLAFLGTRPKMRTFAVSATVLFGVVLLLVAFWVGLLAPTLDRDPTFDCGLAAAVFSVLFFASPLVQIYTILRTRNVGSFPILFVVMSAVAMLFSWLYGLVIDDMFVFIPSLISFAITVLQILLYVAFVDKKNFTTCAAFKDYAVHQFLI